MAKSALFLVLLGTLACNPNVVDAVDEPLPAPRPVMPSPLESSLIHRYSFDGDAMVVLDSKGAAHGQLVGTTLAGDGTLPVSGEHSGQYVNLPNGIVSGLADATFEAWLTWNGGGAWQRIFDFGSSAGGEDMPGPTGVSYLFLTTASSLDTGRMLAPALRVAYSQNGVDDEEICYAAAPFPTGTETHVAVVIDQTAKTMSLYEDGARLRECALTRPLSAIDDVNNWLGHSNYVADLDLSGIFDEFRVYGAALSAAELADSFVAGPDASR
jgi:Concanavalin A-like lectin/glucanases superfamily